MTRAVRRFLSGTVSWSFVAAVLLLLTYLLPAYLRSITHFDTTAVLLSLRNSLLSPTFFWWQLGYYLFMVFFFHFLFFYLLAEVVRIRYIGTARAWRTLGGWLAGVLFLQTVNSGFFPHSSLAFELAFGWARWLAALMLLLLLVLGGLHLYLRAYRHWHIKWVLLSFVAASIWGGTVTVSWLQTGSQRELPANRPNVIMIGIDALRPDQLAYMHSYEPTYKSPMPFLDQQLAHSVVFTQAYTTIARTYPSWMAMLTGQSPLQSGVRFNLQDDYGWWDGKVRTLPQYLKQLGYQTIWGIDETSFANLGKRQGFDRVVEPEPGAAFFLVNAAMADIPLVSLLSNSVYGSILFPLTSINRGLGFSYYPSTFSRRLDRAVLHANRDKPLFMAVHFELAHYPTIWADDGTPTSIANIYNHWNIGLPFYRYDLSRVNQQVQELMSALKSSGRLDNAVVIFLSDHGNGFYTGDMGKDRFGKEVFVGDSSTGHGTDVGSLTQQHALLAIRGYGNFKLSAGYRDQLVSLMDITPTLLWTLGIKANERMQGVPLDVLGTVPEHRRVLYFESGLYFSGLGSGKLNLAENLAEKAESYRIRSNGRLVLRNEMLPRWYKIKNRAAYDGHYLLVEGWDVSQQIFKVVVISRVTGEKYPITAATLRMPGVAELGYDFCHYYEKNDPYFTAPAFCRAIVAE